MLIRPITESDLDALRRMHASQGFDYPFPDLSDPIFISKLVVEDDAGRPVMAALARLTCEMYLLVDRDEGVRSAGILPANSCNAGENKTRRLEAGATGGVAEGLLGGQGFSPDSNDAPQAPSDLPGLTSRRPGSPSLLPQAVAETDGSEQQSANELHCRTIANRRAARERWAQLLALHRAGELDLVARGLDDAHAWLPPQIAMRFGRRLESLGWLRDDAWTPYCKRLAP